jgi:hypothetical protein
MPMSAFDPFSIGIGPSSLNTVGHDTRGWVTNVARPKALPRSAGARPCRRQP